MCVVIFFLLAIIKITTRNNRNNIVVVVVEKLDVSYHKINYYTIMVSGLKKPACDLEFLYIYSLLMLLKCAINVLTQTYLVYFIQIKCY